MDRPPTKTSVLRMMPAGALAKAKAVHGDNRPIIHITTELHTMVGEAEAALSADPNVFQRGGRLVHVVTDPSPTGELLRAPGTPLIKPLHPANVREALTRSAHFERLDHRSDKWVPATPPDMLVQALANRGEWPTVRPLRSVVEAPVLRPDGTVLQTAGYDDATAALYVPNADYPEVPDRPTKEEAQVALELVNEPFADFPFATEAHRAACIASVLSLFARPAIDGPMPLTALDGSTRGVGKTRTADSAANMVTGRDASKSAQPRDDEEMRKRLTAIASEGDTMHTLDNCDAEIAYPSLCMYSTTTRWQDRALGRNENISVPNLTAIWLTGNNMTFSGDTTRRTLHVRLESPLENPEDRTGFRHPDLLGWIREHRPELAVAALTVLRAYVVAGRPDMGLKLWGSYEAWSRLIPPALVWLGMPDPMLTRQELASVADTTKNALTVLLEGWARLDPGDGMTVRAVIGTLYPDQGRDANGAADGFDEMRGAIEVLTNSGPGRMPDTTKLGRVLRSARRRVIDDRMFDQIEGHRAYALWRVVTTETARSA